MSRRLEDVPNDPLAHPLTPRERAVLVLLAAGATKPEIARQLGIEAATVTTYCTRIFNKLGAHSRQHAVMLALEAGIIRRDELG
jgi:DNA-binding NarL/FixJ family response regulator